MTMSLGICGALIPGGKCEGQVLMDREVGALIEGVCGRCGTVAAVPAAKVNPQVRRQRNLDCAGLPARFVGLRFEEDDTNRAALGLVREWLVDYGRCSRERKAARSEEDRQRVLPALPAPALFGEPGRGKSHLLSALCVRLIREHDATVLYRSARSLLRELQDFDGDAEQAWKRAVSVDALALDDFGAERASAWRVDQLADLVDARYERHAPILVATNFPPVAWGDMTDERTVSRLRHMTFPVELRGSDRRQQSLSTEGATV